MMKKGPILLILILGTVLASACTGTLSGNVFLDKDGDNQQDDDESQVANVTYTVSLDDAELSSEKTDLEGSYYVILETPGTYCIDISDEALMISSSASTSPAVIQAKADTAESATLSIEDSETETTSEEADTTTDSDDTADDTTTETPASEDTEDTQDTGVVSSGHVCDTPQGITLEMDVPIAVDYTSAIKALETPPQRTVSPGDLFTVDVQFPQSCTFKLLYLPSSLTPNLPSSASAAYDAVTGQFNFNTAIAAAGTLPTSTPLAINSDPLKTYSLALTVDSDIASLESQNVSIAPSVVCPNAATVALKSHSIEINSDGAFEVEQSMTSDTDPVSYGSKITITTVVRNETEVNYDAEHLDLTITTTNVTAMTALNTTQCSSKGQAVACSFALAGGSAVTLTNTYFLPETLENTTTFTTTAELAVESNGTAATYEGDTISLSLTANESSN